MSDPHRQVTFKPEFPIAHLRPGHQHPLFPANPRKGGHDISLKELAHSIYEQGILQPLRGFLVEDGSGDVWVHVGERRLLASQQNISDHPDALQTVPLLLIEGMTPQEAFQESLTEQINRLPLHPIDQFEAFAELKRGGMTEAQIADHYCIAKRVVQQRAALGDIAPDILKAWRGGAIDEACAREFTRLSNHKDQVKLFERQRRSHGLTAQAVRSVLVPDHGDGAKLVNFVGFDAYRLRGGEIREDLFNGIHGVSDAALAGAMAKEKLDAECLRMTAMEGWAWAKPIDDMPAAWRAYDRSVPKAELTPAEKKQIERLAKIIDDESVAYEDQLGAEAQMETIEAAARLRAFTSRQKAKSGCVLSVNAQGELAIDAGVILPAQDDAQSAPVDQGKGKAAAASKADAKPEPDPEPRLSNSQASDLAVILTEAAALVVKGNFRLSMAIALAAFAANADGYPARLQHRGLGSNALKLTGTSNFAKNLAAFVKMKPQQLEGLFAQVVAASLQFGAPTSDRHAMTDADIAAVVNAVDPKIMQAAILKRFDPASYFERAPKAFALAAVEDVFGKGTDKVDASAPKSEAAAFAIENCPPSKWLPIELRPAGYSGPGAKKAVAKKPAAKKKGRK
jgi:ParB family chromosome partitioning protein